MPSAVTVGCVSSLGLMEEIQSGHSVSEQEEGATGVQNYCSAEFMLLAKITILTHFNYNAVGQNVVKRVHQ